MDHSKRLYETTIIINASIEDTQIEALTAHVQETITSNGGEIAAVNKWGRKRLAYAIQKKNNGYYVNIEYLAPGTVVARLEHIFLLDENILRFLTIQLDKKAIEAKKQAAAILPIASELTPTAVSQREPLFTNDAEEVPAVKHP
jgi:small subunit ribosomal protein S6